MGESERLERLVAEAQGSGKYRSISTDFVRRIAAQELNRHKQWKEAVKATRAKLHQVGGAYLESAPDFSAWTERVSELPADPASDQLRQSCREMLKAHASTRERLPILNDFYTDILAEIGPIHSILDLACGLTPLTSPWMPLAPGAEYFACDIYPDMLALDAAFLAHLGYRVNTWVCDLTQPAEFPKVQLGLVLKTFPCLEQVEKGITARLLTALPAEWILVSFPARSLGGRAKGMVENYGGAFRTLLSNNGWAYKEQLFPGELAFLVHKGANL